MKVVLTGGGTGGHITPILAVAHELKKQHPDIYIVYIAERDGKFSEMTADNPDIDEIRTIYAGKLRRYHGESWLRRILDVKTNLLNFRDLFYFAIGTLQALMLLRRLRPDATFLKGGFVGVPAGLASAFLKIPFITHDSDAMPGLANRLVARWAKYHATALPADNYHYPSQQVRQVGVLVGEQYKPVTKQLQESYKKDIGVPEKCQLLLVTGASSGAVAINQAIHKLLPELLEDYPDLYVVHQVGKGKTGVYDGFTHERVKIAELLFPLYPYTGAADLVVTRASANTLAELGVQGRACIVIPHPQLTGGHQIKNAQKLEEQGAAVVVKETTIQKDVSSLDSKIRELLKSDKDRKHLGAKLQELTIPDAAAKLARLLIETAK